MSNAVHALENLGNIRRLINLVATKMLRSHGLHPKQMIMLRFVHAENQVTLTQLARGTATDMAAASRAIGPLVASGWLQKARNAEDSRCWKIKLTPSAKRKMVKINRIYADCAHTMTEMLGAREQEQLLSLLTKVMTGLTATLDELIKRP